MEFTFKFVLYISEVIILFFIKKEYHAIFFFSLTGKDSVIQDQDVSW